MDGSGTCLPELLDLADWRRRVAEIYADVRTAASPEAAWQMWRRERDDLFRDHPQSPLDVAERKSFKGVDYFDYDPAMRFAVDVKPVEDRNLRTWELDDDGTLNADPTARTHGLADDLGRELTLYWFQGYGGGLFVPFTDATSGTETFGAGRYALDGIKGADLGMAGDRVVIDFNFAYNPSCAYSPQYSCPLAPAENRLPEPVRAGERQYSRLAA